MELSVRAAYRIKDAKRKARSELKEKGDWKKMNFVQSFNVTPVMVAERDKLERIDYRKVSKEEFFENYDKLLKPVVITHAQDDWPAVYKWNINKLARKYRNQVFKCGEDDKGNSVKIKMKYFAEYMQRNNVDDSPLYIFDSSYGEHPKKKKLLCDYFVPKYFQDDLFKYASDHRRPPHRWLVMGPARSGTGIHIDPLGTGAWNALVFGHKWWCLFPPQCPKQMLKLKPGEGWKNRSEAISWFSFVYPRTKEPLWPPEFAPIEVLQSAGETMYVPSGWWHVVINLDDTVAVTQNFCTLANFNVVWYKTAKSRPRLARNWFERLKIMRPEIATLADQIDLSSKCSQVYVDSSSSSSSSSSLSSDSDSDSSFNSQKAASLSSDDGVGANLRMVIRNRVEEKRRSKRHSEAESKEKQATIPSSLSKPRRGSNARNIKYKKSLTKVACNNNSSNNDCDGGDDRVVGDDNDCRGVDDNDNMINSSDGLNKVRTEIGQNRSNNHHNNDDDDDVCSEGNEGMDDVDERTSVRYDRSEGSFKNTSTYIEGCVSDESCRDDSDSERGIRTANHEIRRKKSRTPTMSSNNIVGGSSKRRGFSSRSLDGSSSDDDSDGECDRSNEKHRYQRDKHSKRNRLSDSFKIGIRGFVEYGNCNNGSNKVSVDHHLSSSPFKRHQQKVAPGKRKSSRDRQSRRY